MAISKREKLPLGEEWGITDSEYFMNRVKEEKQRTDRSGICFSIILVDFHKLLNRNSKIRFLNGKLKKEILFTIVKETRCTDIKGWYESDKLGLLCPDTDSKAAALLIEKLQVGLEENLLRFSELKDLVLDKIILTSSTYPDCINGEFEEEQQRNPDLSNDSTHITEHINQKDYSIKNGKNSWKMKIKFPFFMMNNKALKIDSVFLPLITSTTLHHSLIKGIKRSLDIVASFTGILLLSPLLLVIAILVKTTSRGPVLFKQERHGYLCKKFTFLKFRSMYANVDQKLHETYITNFINGELSQASGEQETVYKLKDDPRITEVGKFLRKTSLDELPQLFNVFKGEMSLVGPRPPIPYEVNKYKLWHLKRIMEVKPGVTGLWQVSGRSSTTFEEMVRLDLYYVNHWSLKLDFKIILKTIKVLFTMKGAY